jgi:hypothetical protein
LRAVKEDQKTFRKVARVNAKEIRPIRVGVRTRRERAV